MQVRLTATRYAEPWRRAERVAAGRAPSGPQGIDSAEVINAIHKPQSADDARARRPQALSKPAQAADYSRSVA